MGFRKQKAGSTASIARGHGGFAPEPSGKLT